MKYTVRTPVEGVNDTVGGVSFANGVAVIDDETHQAELRYFQGAGYTVEPEEDPADDSKPTRGRRAAKSEEQPA